MIDVKEREFNFKPGNKEWCKRKDNKGGRPPAIVTSIRQDIEENPRRARELLDNLFYLAFNAEGEKVRLTATMDYLDRIGFRAPKESTLTIQGQIVVGTPEDYRRASLLLSADKEQEQRLLSMPVNASPHNEYCTTQDNTSTPLDTQPPVDALSDGKVDKELPMPPEGDTAGGF